MFSETDLTFIVNTFRKHGWTVAFAESCTGGRLSADLTTIPGSSDVVVGSMVCYQTRLKRELLGLEEVNEENVVSPATARGMALQAHNLLRADIGVGTTGYLDGERVAYYAVWAPDKHDGTLEVYEQCLKFSEDSSRGSNREQVVRAVMDHLLRIAKGEA